ncbi:hypothetical protein T4A_770 [Trichinella pseudospiralis]|uniref:Uncharacterized protein n=1 Tax=Trichinella pseudospiralis TaxID=6337 RepID=A0A0V1E2R7_TRIPS|nr:hypothetical protein T4A_14129 [Trichinella pseudospiralis]KRY67443.1 hypothetical protein T4A_9655 [Trichinella pseudospiralis]KRY71414.1 hypothetical protein T4A_770 [Trichinella pseudospiralis]
MFRKTSKLNKQTKCREKLSSSKVDIIGISRRGTICQAQWTYAQRSLLPLSGDILKKLTTSLCINIRNRTLEAIYSTTIGLFSVKPSKTQ